MWVLMISMARYDPPRAVQHVGQQAAEQKNDRRVEHPEHQADEPTQDAVEEVVPRVVREIHVEEHARLEPEHGRHTRARDRPRPADGADRCHAVDDGEEAREQGGREDARETRRRDERGQDDAGADQYLDLRPGRQDPPADQRGDEEQAGRRQHDERHQFPSDVRPGLAFPGQRGEGAGDGVEDADAHPQQKPDAEHARDVPALDDGAQERLDIAAGRDRNQPPRHGHDLVRAPLRRAQDVPDDGASQEEERDDSQQPVEGNGRRHHHHIVLAQDEFSDDPAEPPPLPRHPVLHLARARLA
jgi:hypothetical protein